MNSKNKKFKEKLKNGDSIDELLPEICASKRGVKKELGMRGILMFKLLEVSFTK